MVAMQEKARLLERHSARALQRCAVSRVRRLELLDQRRRCRFLQQYKDTACRKRLSVRVDEHQKQVTASSRALPIKILDVGASWCGSYENLQEVDLNF